ncbi:MAG: transcriptional attenuator, LytR family [Chthonomonadales bacterium]|nr:transcriptional attenuator, LytR family [Chthonomonadales bacterium]
MEPTDQPEPERQPQNETPEATTPESSSDAIKVKRRRTLWRVVKATVLLGFVLVSLGIGTTVGYLNRTSDLFRVWWEETRANPTAVLTNPTDPLAAFRPDLQLPAKTQHTANILLIGADSDYSETLPVALKNTHGRSDALMVLRVDFDNNKINVLSIPRDTAVFIPHYDNKIHKINAAHAFGGPRLTQQTVENAFGIHTDYFLSLNFDAFQKVVDAIDGVDLNVGPLPLDYDDNWGNLHIHLKPGMQHLTGYTAMGYVRIRHNDDDLHRAERQHEFIEAMRSKIMNRDTFGKLPNALNQVTQNIVSDLTTAQQLTLVNFARNVPKANLQVATLPSTEGRSFVFANVPESEKLISRLFFADRGDTVKVTVPDQPKIASRRGLVARSNGTVHRRRRRRRHIAPAISPRETLGLGGAKWGDFLS